MFSYNQPVNHIKFCFFIYHVHHHLSVHHLVLLFRQLRIFCHYFACVISSLHWFLVATEFIHVAAPAITYNKISKPKSKQGNWWIKKSSPPMKVRWLSHKVLLYFKTRNVAPITLFFWQLPYLSSMKILFYVY